MSNNTPHVVSNTSRGSGIFWHNEQVLDPHGPSLRVMILSLGF